MSLEWLAPEVQRLFAQVALIPGVDFGLEVAGVVAKDASTSVRDGLNLLADEQLLEAKGKGRYQFHDLVRLLGQEQWWQGEEIEQEAKAIAGAAAEWYFVQADWGDDALRRQVSQGRLQAQRRVEESEEQTQQRLLKEALAWFHQEWENIQAVVRWASEQKQWQLTQKLALLLDCFAMLQGFRADLLPLYKVALAAARQGNDKRGEANTLKATADVLQFKKRSDEALEKYDQAIAIYREVGARLGEANTLQSLGCMTSNSGQPRRGSELLEQALVIYRDIDARWGQATALQNLAVAYNQSGKVKESLQAAYEAQEIRQQLGLESTHAPYPEWVKSLINFAQQGKWQFTILFIGGVIAFPFFLILLISITVWRLCIGRFRH